MPSRSDIERFKTILNSLGSEPEIRARKQETIEEVAPPEEGLPSDISQLLDSLGDGESTADETGPAIAAPDEAVAPGGPAKAAENEELPDLDFASLFGEEKEPESIEQPSQAAKPAPKETQRQAPKSTPRAPPAPPAGQPTAPEPAAEEPDMDLGDIASITDLNEMDTLEEKPADETPLELPEGGLVMPEEIGLAVPDEATDEVPALDGFDLPTEEAAEPGVEPGEIPDAATDEVPALDGFDLPAEEAAEPGVEPDTVPDEATDEIPALDVFDLPAEEAAEPGAEPGEVPDAVPDAATDEIPALDVFDLPAEEAAEPDVEPGAEPGEVPDETSALDGFDIPEGESFEIPGEAAGEAPDQAPSGEEEPGSGEDQAAEPEEASIDDMQLDEFSLPETVEQFGVSEKKEAPGKAREAPRAAQPQEAAEELGGAELDLRISNEDFGALQKCLASLPRNLKIEVEEVIAAAKGTPADLKRLIGMLISGAGIEQIAGLTGKIAGHRIKLPPVVAKMTGAAFEARQRTFAYAFRENVLPILRIVLLAAAGLSGLAFLGFRFVYTPLLAQSRYQRGLAHATAGRYPLAEQDFSFASRQWRMKPWFYRYADTYRNREEFARAEGKYEELLKWWPGDKKAILDYARMKSVDQRDFRKADSLLNRILEDSMYDPDALLAAGDNQMEWALEDRKHYENARSAYADYVAKNGENDAILQRMMRWYVRTDNAAEADRLRALLAEQKTLKVMPEVWAELGGYLLDEGMGEYVKEILFRALDADPRLPETYWNLSRYFRSVKDTAEEEKAVRETARLLDAMGREKRPMSDARAVMNIEGRTRLGEILFQTERRMEAEKEFQEAIRQTESLRRGRRLAPRDAFGRPYADLGDFHYYETRNLGQAYNLYESAQANGYDAPAMRYRFAAIQYQRGDFTRALLGFLRLADEVPQNNNLLYSVGNALWFKNDLYAAQGFYLRLRDNLQARRNSITNLAPQEQPEHRALLEFLMRTENNLGATLSRLADRNADRRKRSEALVYLAEATEIWDLLSRNPDTLRRSEAQKLPFLNTQAIIKPQSRYEVMVYRDIPQDMDSKDF